MDVTLFDFKPTITGDLVALRPIQAEDVDVTDHLIRAH
ncbi:hypothetical protein C884_02234 [Kocuria palustris PEL]|uniref:Uncharacterized protein n=1 Tax=Kocuria palustris PEL TaxID=1236550 RepID=M2XW90_9MICC|nr:hypothetical protein C884_02234 [Kocuria palustris PEL]